MNHCIFIVFSLHLLLLVTTTTSQLTAVVEGGDDTQGVTNKCFDKERHALLFKAPIQDPFDSFSTWRDDEHDCCEISHSLLNLTYLNHLDLSGNSFYGNIPTFIGSLTKLSFLNLGNNNLNGTIHKSIGSMVRLRYLSLSYNSLHGTIPLEFGNLSNLQNLSLSYMGRCRVENIEWLSHLSHLEELRMDGISLAKANHWVDVILSLQKLLDLSLLGCELSEVMHPYSSFRNSTSSIEFLYLSHNSLNSSMYHWLLPLTSNKLRELYLSSNMLDGIPKYLGNLCSLEWLEFNNNSIVVKFSDFLNLSGCTSLALQSLDTSHSQFTGPLSDEIQKFSSLENLDLSHNQLNGTISEKLWELHMLETLDISFNNLIVPSVPSTDHSSSLSSIHSIDLNSLKLGPHFPKWIQTLKKLTHLDISNTGISDTIPLEFWNMWPSQLQFLNLFSNNISGEVADLVSNFGFSEIDLSSNNFSGPIPNVTSTLNSLNLSRNKFSGGISFICQIVDGFLSFLDLSHNLLIGELPDCLWHLKELNVLNLGHNNLFERLPPSVGSFLELQVLYLYKNNFSGELPLSLKSCTSLISLNLGANKFSGNVPVWIGENLSGLYVLILSSNNFFGTIPIELCQLANLQILDLSMNNLHGNIPSCLSNLTSMVQSRLLHDVIRSSFRGAGEDEINTYVDHAIIEWQGNDREFSSSLRLLKSIELSRRIPSTTQLQSSEPSRYDGNVGLCGLPLSRKCPGDDESEVPPLIGKNEGDGKGADELQRWFYIGGGIGFATGFWMACGALFLNRRGRHMFFHVYDSFKDWVYVKVVFIASLQNDRHM
ncbi:hypothetical protein LXL04_004573 [Taraxacum kok-saghyz]